MLCTISKTRHSPVHRKNNITSPLSAVSLPEENLGGSVKVIAFVMSEENLILQYNV